VLSFPVMKITEPATMITDYMLALSCAVFAILTLRLQSPHRALPVWFLAFLTGSIAFTDIPRLVERALEESVLAAPGSIAEVLEIDRFTRQRVDAVMQAV